MTVRPVQTALVDGYEQPVGPMPHSLGPTNSRLRTVRRTRRAHSYLIVFAVRGAT